MSEHHHEMAVEHKVEQEHGVPYTFERSYCLHCGAELGKRKLRKTLS